MKLSRLHFALFIAFLITIGGCAQKKKESISVNRNKKNEMILIGTYTQKEGHVDGKAEGIYISEINREKESIDIINTISGITNPSYAVAHPELEVIYAVSEVAGSSPQGEVYAFALNENRTKASLLSKTSTHGNAPCHLHVDPVSDRLYVVNYMGGIINYKINKDGSLEASPQIINYLGGKAGSARQETPHPHMVKRVGPYIYVTDLGTDEIITYSLNTDGKLEEKSRTKTIEGGGPRHFIESSDDSKLYVLNELNLTIQVFETNNEGKQMKSLQSIELHDGLIDESGHSGSAIKIHPSGKYLYAAMRASNGSTNNTIHHFAIDPESGLLTHKSKIHTLGSVPRDFEISPDGKSLIVANQNSDNIVIFDLDKNSGMMSKTKINSKIFTPVSIQYFN